MAWVAIVAVAVVLGAVFQRIGLPAPWLLGPMLTGVAFGCSPMQTPRVPRRLFVAAQTIVGIVLAGAVRPTFVAVIATHWWLMLLVVAGTIVLSMAVAWVLARSGALDAETATLGSTPAGAAVMTALAAEYGADARIVAFMQYIRIVLVVSSASLISHFIFHVTTHPPPAVTEPASSQTIALTLAAAALGFALARAIRLPAPGFLGPLLLGAALGASGVLHVGLPWWLLDASYITIGLFVGLIFTVHSVTHVTTILPQLLGATAALIGGCWLMGGVLVTLAHLDPFTAYLATSPGALDSITIIALGGGADVATVVALQTARIFIVILTGPSIARFVARLTSSA